MSHHHDQVHHHESSSDSPRAFARAVAVTIALVVIKALSLVANGVLARGFRDAHDLNSRSAWGIWSPTVSDHSACCSPLGFCSSPGGRPSTPS